MSVVHNSPLPDRSSATVRGRAQREAVPRTKLADVADRAVGFDPVSILEHQNADRLASLVPIRFQRMLESPFAFLRGTAVLQAMDLAGSPSTDIEVQLCGDAHLSNFGVFSSPERRLVFDVNDFDETARGPFEWDVKRLSTSLAVAAKSLGLSASQQERAAQSAASTYRTSMREFATQPFLDVWYQTLDLDTLLVELRDYLTDSAMAHVGEVIERAPVRTAARAYEKLVEVVDGRPRIVHDPPLLVPFDLHLAPDETSSVSALLNGVIDGYSSTLQEDQRGLLSRFTPVDAAMKVVGVGSVGTRCWIILLLGRDIDDPFFLQVKEAGPSVIDNARGVTSECEPGERVVRGQQLVQAATDPFLGWRPLRISDGVTRSYYVRQLYDHTSSVNIERLAPASIVAYARVCAWTLARAHARSGAAAEIAGYLGKGEKFDESVAAYALAYQSRVESDFAQLQRAATEGRIAGKS